MLEAWLLHGAYQTKYVQERFAGYDEVFIFISSVFDPVRVFVLLFPFVFFFRPSNSITIVMCGITAEWLNAVIKWAIYEDRPYWWVGEHNEHNIHLQQTRITCETGPGSPSGHVMVTTAAYLLLCKCIISEFYSFRLQIWSLFFSILLVVATSRVYVAAHFPHQCVLGVLCGIITSCIVDKYFDFKTWSLRSYVKFSLLILLTTVSTHAVLDTFGVDPETSVKLAKRWCRPPGVVSVKTTPLFALMRDVAFPLGIGAAMSMPQTLELHNIIEYRIQWPFKFLAAVISYFFGQSLFRTLPTQSDDSTVVFVYLMAVAQYMLFAFLVTYAMPRAMCHKLLEGEKRCQQEKRLEYSNRVKMTLE